MRFDALKVGELSKRTGLTIRTLHHYDEIGLLKPSLHTESGHRLYNAGDVARLQQVLSLRQVGFSLEEVRDCLDRPGFSPVKAIEMQVARLREQIEAQRVLCERLEALAAHLRGAGEVSAEDFLRTIEVMTDMQRHYTPEQWRYLQQRREQLGDKGVKRAGAEWAELMALVRGEIESGTPPRSRKAQALAKRWMALVKEFSGGNRGVEKALAGFWKTSGVALVSQLGLRDSATGPTMQEYMAYIAKAMKAGKR